MEVTNMKMILISVLCALILLSFVPLFTHSNLVSNSYKLNFWEQLKWQQRCGDKHVICE